jgi:RHH-type rel operon transcriptional repressor/antitoxin RelB
MTTMEKTFSVRLPIAIHNRLKDLTQTTGRTKSFLAVEALDAYLSQQAWQISEVKAGIEEADKGEFATDEEMNTIFSKYEN